MLAGKRILLGITGSIAAYKAPLLVRELVRAGAEVKVVMTPAAADFVSPLTLSTLSRNPVLRDLFNSEEWANHVMLGRWADLMLIAPLSCNTLAKMASGLCDNLLMAIFLSATCPVMVAPAMDEDMWKHPATARNLEIISGFGCHILEVGYGELASGLTGEGRMAEPGEIRERLEGFFAHSGQLKGKKAVVTAGPTYEAIDPVRFIGNHSSGRMGYAIARELHIRGADVTLVSGPVSREAHNGIKLVQVTSAEEMFRACQPMAGDYDIAVMAAAVADYSPAERSGEKIRKSEEELTLKLVRTPDILRSFGEQKTDRQVLVGFALETGNEEVNARNKLKSKNADLLVLNSLRDAGAGFGGDTNRITLFFRDGRKKAFPLKSKTEVARDIVDSITEMIS